MIEIKCPNCGSEDYDCYDTNCCMEMGVHWDKCYCEECGAQFDIKYIAVEIEVKEND